MLRALGNLNLKVQFLKQARFYTSRLSFVVVRFRKFIRPPESKKISTGLSDPYCSKLSIRVKLETAWLKICRCPFKTQLQNTCLRDTRFDQDDGPPENFESNGASCHILGLFALPNPLHIQSQYMIPLNII